MIKILDELIEIDVPDNEKAFVAIGTCVIAEKWAVDGSKPFIIPLSSPESFDRHGFDEDDYEKCQALEVGQVTDDFDYEGVYVMRIQ